MRTLTEIDGFKLQRVLTALQSWTQEGKPLDEIPQLLSTEFKVEGDPLKFLQHAVDLAKDRPAGAIKRILVGQLAEGEKAPPQAIVREEQIYLVDLYPSKASPAKRRDEDDSKRRPGKGDRGKKNDGRRGEGRSNDARSTQPRDASARPAKPAQRSDAPRSVTPRTGGPAIIINPPKALAPAAPRPAPKIIPLATPKTVAAPVVAVAAAEVDPSTLPTPPQNPEALSE